MPALVSCCSCLVIDGYTAKLSALVVFEFCLIQFFADLANALAGQAE
jgi:hypothetical protein